MLEFLSENTATIVVFIILALIMFLVIRKMVKDKRAGRSSCSCGAKCGCCPNSELCGGSRNTN